MARGTSEAERREAVTLIPAGEVPPEDDIDESFEKWRTSFESGEEPGKLRAYQIPLDERGNPQATAKNQIRLGAWPIDLYDFDELCNMLIRDFMPAEKILAVRFLGIRPGHAGVQFNKIVVLRAPKFNPETSSASGPAGESVTAILKALQEGNQRTLEMVQSMRPPPVPDQSFERIMQMSQAMNAPMMQMLATLLPALAGKPQPVGMDINGLSGLLDVAGKIADLRGGGGGGDTTGNDLVDTIRAVVPIAKPALETFAEMMRRSPMPAGAVQALPNPNPVQGGNPQVARSPQAVPPRPGPAPGSQPTQPPPAAVGVAPGPSATLGDIPSGDQQMFAELKPQIDQLVTMAEQGSPATGAADLLFDTVIIELPDEFYGKLADLIGGPNFIKYIAVLNPKVSGHEPWFRQFQTQIMLRYDQEENDAQEPTAANS